MQDEDRDYCYIAKTFDAPGLSLHDFERVMLELAIPTWQALRGAGVLQSLQTFRKVGDVDLHTTSASVRDWQYFILAELGGGAEPASALEAEIAAGIDVEHFRARNVDYLSNELVARPASSGTAIPAPSARFSSLPTRQLAAIEYIQIPPEHWDNYRRFMKEVMGPVGTRMVAVGHCYQVQILERVRLLHRDASLPSWNRLHILWGEFDDPFQGFFRHTNEAIRFVLGSNLDVQKTLEPVNRYRVKPRMTKNRRIDSLCL